VEPRHCKHCGLEVITVGGRLLHNGPGVNGERCYLFAKVDEPNWWRRNGGQEEADLCMMLGLLESSPKVVPEWRRTFARLMLQLYRERSERQS
jgi:hypothetical protein